MNCTIAQLRRKEVINESDGSLLGFVNDVEIDTKSARLVAIVILGKPKFLGIFGRRKKIIVPWSKIRLIGKDTILSGQSSCSP